VLKPTAEPSRVSGVSFVVHGEPVGQNVAYRIVTFRPKGGGHAHATLKLSDEGKAWKIEVARMATMVRPRDWDEENEFIVEAVWFFRTRRPDVDGPAKLTLDALAACEIDDVRFRGLMKNDRQIWTLTQRRELDPEHPRAEITVRLRKPWKAVQPTLL
jgi:Holliday junction resolvase RusA-like endonuclease